MAIKTILNNLDQETRAPEKYVKYLESTLIELKDDEQLFRNIFEKAPIGINQVAPNGKSRHANLAMQHFLGYTDREMTGRPFTEWTHPEDVAPSIELVQRLLNGEKSYESIEKRYIRKDGAVVWGRTTVSWVCDQIGEVDYFITMVEDITERKRVEELSNIMHELLLSVSRERSLQKVLEKCMAAGLLVSEMDAGGIYLIDDRGGLKLEHVVGLSKKFVEGARYYPADAPNTYLVTAGKPVYSRHSDLDPSISGDDRGEVLKAFASIPMFNEDNLVGCMNVASHIVEEVPKVSRLFLEKIAYVAGLLIEHTRAEEKQRQSEENFRYIFDNSLDGIMLTSPDGSIFSANPAACRMFGRTEKEICDGGRNILLNKTDLKLIKALDERKKTGRFIGELSHKRQDGSTFPVEVSSTIFRSAEGNKRTCTILRDITDRKKTLKALREREEELQLKTAHLEELNTTLKVLLDQRESEKKKLEENFSQSIHNLIIPYLDRIRKTDLDTLQKEYIDVLESNLKETIQPYKHRMPESMLRLSPSETLIVNHIRQGHGNKEIASMLNVSPRTVEFHRDNIRKKLGLKNRKINLRTYLADLP